MIDERSKNCHSHLHYRRTPKKQNEQSVLWHILGTRWKNYARLINFTNARQQKQNHRSTPLTYYPQRTVEKKKKEKEKKRNNQRCSCHMGSGGGEVRGKKQPLHTDSISSDNEPTKVTIHVNSALRHAQNAIRRLRAAAPLRSHHCPCRTK